MEQTIAQIGLVTTVQTKSDNPRIVSQATFFRGKRGICLLKTRFPFGDLIKKILPVGGKGFAVRNEHGPDILVQLSPPFSSQ